ncbi:hypothetical protein [Streptomyces scabiei]|uniref:hypothetical protein n=1 Tax=Streptomyces scabiei TaxID=1930 RepID=UPI0029AD0611|nr:hypothetical protein [Streptomyces scabiei]MDX3520663.1 hypothetical protein [Streptomyces scabiei]
MSAPTASIGDLSPECALARRAGYDSLHDDCRQTDIPLPGAVGLLLQARCPCACHPPEVRKP